MTISLSLLILAVFRSVGRAQTTEWPDIRTVAADLKVPAMVDSSAAAGLRVRRVLTGWDAERVYHALYLPEDWNSSVKLPVIVEYAGNGGYRDPLGDECTGRPEDCSLGYGMTAGKGFLWICVPFLNNDGTDLSITWWGDAPEFDPRPTLKYCHAAIDDACTNYGGDPTRIVLSGFSRGAIACNYLGLYDDETAKLWRAFVPCSHYDGVRKWPFPNSDAASARIRLARLNGRPQFICGERNQTEETRRFLQQFDSSTQMTFAATGFRNHSDQWILRPSPARVQLREWLQDIITTRQD